MAAFAGAEAPRGFREIGKAGKSPEKARSSYGARWPFLAFIVSRGPASAQHAPTAMHPLALPLSSATGDRAAA